MIRLKNNLPSYKSISINKVFIYWILIVKLLRLTDQTSPSSVIRTPRNTPSKRGGVVIPYCCRRWGGSDRSPGFFDLDERYQRLSENGDPLVKLAALIDFEAFRPKLATALKQSDGSKGGRPPYDAVLMFKILVLQTLYTLSDDATEFQIRDTLSVITHPLARVGFR